MRKEQACPGPARRKKGMCEERVRMARESPGGRGLCCLREPERLQIVGGQCEVAVALHGDRDKIVDGVEVFCVLEDGVLGDDGPDLGEYLIGVGGTGGDMVYDVLYLLDDVFGGSEQKPILLVFDQDHFIQIAILFPGLVRDYVFSRVTCRSVDQRGEIVIGYIHRGFHLQAVASAPEDSGKPPAIKEGGNDDVDGEESGADAGENGEWDIRVHDWLRLKFCNVVVFYCKDGVVKRGVSQ